MVSVGVAVIDGASVSVGGIEVNVAATIVCKACNVAVPLGVGVGDQVNVGIGVQVWVGVKVGGWAVKVATNAACTVAWITLWVAATLGTAVHVGESVTTEVQVGESVAGGIGVPSTVTTGGCAVPVCAAAVKARSTAACTVALMAACVAVNSGGLNAAVAGGIGVAGGAVVGAIACTVASTAAWTVPCCAAAVPEKSGARVAVELASGEVVGTMVMPTGVDVGSAVRCNHNCKPTKPAAMATRMAAKAVIVIRLKRIPLPSVPEFPRCLETHILF